VGGGGSDRGRDLRPVLRQQHLRERTEILARLAFAAAVHAGLLLLRLGVGSVIRDGRRRQLGLCKEQVEAIAERLLLLLALGKRQQEGVAQDGPVREAHLGHRAHRIDAFSR